MVPLTGRLSCAPVTLTFPKRQCAETPRNHAIPHDPTTEIRDLLDVQRPCAHRSISQHLLRASVACSVEAPRTFVPSDFAGFPFHDTHSLERESMTGKVFRNYRRANPNAWADRIFERLDRAVPARERLYGRRRPDPRRVRVGGLARPQGRGVRSDACAERLSPTRLPWSAKKGLARKLGIGHSSVSRAMKVRKIKRQPMVYPPA
jgi:hypothetical protein